MTALIGSAIHVANAFRSVLFIGESDIDTHGRVGAIVLWVADHHFDDIAVLTEKLVSPENVAEVFRLHDWLHSGDIDEIFLADADTGKMFSAERICFALGGLLLFRSLLFLRLLLCIFFVHSQSEDLLAR